MLPGITREGDRMKFSGPPEAIMYFALTNAAIHVYDI